MATAIWFPKAENCEITNITIVGFDIGVDIGGTDNTISKNQFHSTDTAIRAKDVDGLTAVGNIQKNLTPNNGENR